MKMRGAARKNLLQHRARRMQRLHQHNRAADDKRQENPDGHHVGVKHGQQNNEAVVRHGRKHDAAALDVVKQIAVRQHRAFGFARCAGGVNDDGQVRLGTSRSAECGIRSAEFRKILDAQEVQRGPSRKQFFFVNGQFHIGDHQVNAAVIQNVADLARLEKIIDGHHHRVREQNAKDARDKLRAIFQPERDAVAGLDAEMTLQMRGGCLRLREQFGV